MQLFFDVIGPTVTGVHTLALASAVAATLAVTVVSSATRPILLLASMLLPLSMLLLAPLMLLLFPLLLGLYCYWPSCSCPCQCGCWHPWCCKCFFCCWPLFIDVNAVVLVHAVAGTHAVAGVTAVVDPIVVDVLATWCCSMMFLMLIVVCCSLAYAGKPSGPWSSGERPLDFPILKKFSFPWSETFFISPCRKGLLPGIGSLFQHGELKWSPARGIVKKTL